MRFAVVCLFFVALAAAKNAVASPTVSAELDLGYRAGVTKDFLQKRALMSVLELQAAAEIAPVPGVPVAVGVLVSTPVANAGSSKTGVKMCLGYSGGLSAKAWLPVKNFWVTPFAKYSFKLFGSFECTAESALAGDDGSGYEFEIPDSELAFTYTNVGSHATVGGIVPVSRLFAVTFAIDAGFETNRLHSIVINDVDMTERQRVAFENEKLNSYSVFVGARVAY